MLQFEFELWLFGDRRQIRERSERWEMLSFMRVCVSFRVCFRVCVRVYVRVCVRACAYRREENCI